MTNNTTAPALTDEQRVAIEAALSISADLENERSDGSFLSEASVQALRALLTSPRAAVPAAEKLPDGSGFMVASLPLPAAHWLYAPRGEWDDERDTYAETPHPILTHAQRDAVVAAVRYAVRGATMCGKESDFDPDALVLNAVYALCGPRGFDLDATPAAPVANPSIDIEQMLRDCVPGGDIVDPQLVCDNIRGWFEDHAPAAPVAELVPDPLRRRVERLLVELHAEGRLSEGQCAKMLDISRVDWRELAEFLAPAAQADAADGTRAKDVVTREQVMEWALTANIETGWFTEQLIAALGDFAILARAVASPATASGLPAWFDTFLTNVCEIPDRNSPVGEPDVIIATLDELKNCALNAIEKCVPAPATADEYAAFAWPPLPAFPESFAHVAGHAYFTEHQMQGYANAYGEAIRTAQAATPHSARVAALEAENRELAEFVVAVGGFWGESRSKLIGPLSLAEVIKQAMREQVFAPADHCLRAPTICAGSAAAPADAREPIYQTCFMQGQWRDVDRGEYERAKSLREDLARIVYAVPADAGEAVAPSGYAYRYPSGDGTVIRFNNGEEVNGSRPLEAVPYWLGTQGGKGGEA